MSNAIRSIKRNMGVHKRKRFGDKRPRTIFDGTAGARADLRREKRKGKKRPATKTVYVPGNLPLS